jgi:hypothetical protein
MSTTEKKIILVVPRSRSKPIKITIDPEFASLIAPLGSAEYAQLEASLRGSIGGPRDAIVAWESPEKELILLDGHNRAAIMTKIAAEDGDDGFECEVDIIRQEFRTIPTRADALLWIEENQVGRRNLNDDQRAIIWDSIRERRSAIAKTERAETARAAQGEPRLSAETDEKPKEPAPKRDTRKEIAKESGLPENKFKRVAELKKTNPEKVADVRAGKTSLRKAVKESKPAKPAPGTESLNAKELAQWFCDQDSDAIEGLHIHSDSGHDDVHLDFRCITPDTAKKMVEYYLRLKTGHAPKVTPTPEPESKHHRLPPNIRQILQLMSRRLSNSKWAVRKYTEISVTDPNGHKRTGEGESYQSEGMARSAMKGMIRQQIHGEKWSEKDFVIATAARWKVVDTGSSGGDTDMEWTIAVGFASKADADRAVAFAEREWALSESERAAKQPAPEPAADALTDDLDFVRAPKEK